MLAPASGENSGRIMSAAVVYVYRHSLRLIHEYQSGERRKDVTMTTR
jgi:hypothetical protein